MRLLSVRPQGAGAVIGPQLIGPQHGLRWVDPRVDEWTRGCGTERLLADRDARAAAALPPAPSRARRRLVGRVLGRRRRAADIPANSASAEGEVA